MAVLFGLVAVALGIAFAATTDEYQRLAAGEHVTGTVTRLEPHRSYVTVEISYGADGQTRTYPTLEEAKAYPLGAKVELLHSRSGTIRASTLEEHRPPVALPIGLALSGLMTIACVALHFMLRLKPSAARQPLDVVVEAIARTRNLRLAGAMLFVPLAVCFALVPLADPEATRGPTIGLEVLAAVTLAVAGWMALVAFRLRAPRKSGVLELIERRPQEIAQAYVQRETRRGITMHSVIIQSAKGKREALVLPEADAAVVIAEIRRRAPQAQGMR